MSTTFYAVRKGLNPGVYQTWPECQTQIKCPGAIFKKFNSYEEAYDFVNNVKPITVKPTVKINVKEDEIEVYTDGAASNNGKHNVIAGYGVYFPNDTNLNVAERLFTGPNGEHPSNQRAELKACIEAIKIINVNFRKEKSILLITDSKYSIQCVYPTENKYGKMSQAWASKWSTNGWIKGSNEPVKNRDLIEELYTLVRIRNIDPDKGNIRFVHVNGHSGVYGNERADKLAVQGRNKKKT